MSERTVSIHVSGPFACFSRPEFKVERVSYPVITPSAARGILESIFWKPEVRYEIRRIGILNAGSSMVILRNEIEVRQGTKPIIIDAVRQQRSSLILRDVAYLIEAAIVLRPHATDPLEKYRAQFERRVERGQYHHSPYLGNREFAAEVRPTNAAQPETRDLPIGTMLFDIAFIESEVRQELTFKRPNRPAPVAGFARALFFEAAVENGWLNVPAEKYRDLYRLEGGDVSRAG